MRAALPIAPRPTPSWPERHFPPLEPTALAGLRFGIAEGLPLDRLDDTVAAAFDAAIKRLDGAGVRVSRETLPLFDGMSEVNAKGGISPPEACAIHRDRMRRRANDIDPNVLVRIERGCAVSAADYVDMVRERDRLVRAMDARLAGLDALLMPTTSIVAPTIAEVADPKVFAARNAALLRNTAIINFFDLCAISLPLPVAAGAAGRASCWSRATVRTTGCCASPRQSRNRSQAERLRSEVAQRLRAACGDAPRRAFRSAAFRAAPPASWRCVSSVRPCDVSCSACRRPSSNDSSRWIRPRRLQPVQQARQPRPLDAQRGGKLRLRQPRIGADHDQNRELCRADVDLRLACG